MSFDEYQPIDYEKWDFSGQGKNIMGSLNGSERRIWKAALALQDKRNDTGHAEVATYFALKLLERVSSEREIVIPSIILHDIGYDIDPQEFRDAFLAEPETEEDKKIIKDRQIRIRLEHQIRGCVLAYDILNKMSFPREYVGEILRINADHDTHFYESTQDGKVVQDADVLWRVTKPCIDAYLSDKSLDEKRRLSRESTFGLLNLSASKEIAEVELENAMAFYSE